MKILKCDICQKEYEVNDNTQFMEFGERYFCKKCQEAFEESWDEFSLLQIKQKRGKDWIKSKLEIK